MPNNPDSFCLAQNHLQAGQAAEAEKLLHGLAHAQPPDARACHLLGVLAYQKGDALAARDHFRAAARAQPTNPDWHSCLGAAYHELGRPAEAVACHREALRLDPANLLALTNLGVVLMALGRTEEATAYFAEAWRRGPNDAGAACNLAAARKASGAANEAMSLFREALRLDPNLAEAHNNLGDLLDAQGQRAEAEACFQKTLQLAPRLAQAYLNLGKLWERTGRLQQALRLYQQAVHANPQAWELHARLAETFLACNRPQEALHRCRQALALRPREAQLHNDLGNACAALGRLDEAVAAYAEAQQLLPAWSVPYHNRGVTEQSQGRLHDAQACFREAVRLDPSDVVAHSTLVGSLHFDPTITGAALLAEHRRWSECHASNLPFVPHFNVKDTERRLRVGYVSPDFRNHAVAFFLEPVLAHHDPQQFETFAYAEVPAPDETTARLRGLVHQWRDTPGLSDDELAARIRDDGIDLLVDLGGQLAGNRLLTFARRPAPVQVSYLGYPGTTGLTAIGYRITDHILDPPGAEPDYSEDLVRLESPFCSYAPPPPLPVADAPPSETTGVVTFGSLHKLEKLNDEVLDVWCALLREVPASRLLLCRNILQGDTAARLARRFLERGISGDRLVLHRVEAVHMGHLLVYNAIDVALDTFPWSGHTTACEALWMGVPVVTLRGLRCAGRMTASVLASVGLAAQVAHTTDDYLEIAVSLAKDMTSRRELRRGLRGRLLASSLCDGRTFTRKLEAAYQGLWRDWCRTT